MRGLMTSGLLLGVLLLISSSQANLITYKPKIYAYYNASAPNTILAFKADRAGLIFMETESAAKPCFLGNEQVCIQSEQPRLFFTIPKETFEAGKEILNTDIIMKAQSDIELYNISTKVMTLEQYSLGEGIIANYNYSPVFGLMSIVISTKTESVTYVSMNQIGYGAIEPMPELASQDH